MLHSRPYVQLDFSFCFSRNIHIYLFSQFPMFAHIFNINRFHFRYYEYKYFHRIFNGAGLQLSQRHLCWYLARLLSLERYSCLCSKHCSVWKQSWLWFGFSPNSQQSKKKKKKMHSFEFTVFWSSSLSYIMILLFFFPSVPLPSLEW